MKKLWALLLAIAMVAALAVPALADEGTTTIYFDIGDANFGTVYCYAYEIASEGENFNYGWPGVAMTHVAGSIYSTELSPSWDAIIFNDGVRVQTDDITPPTDGKNLYSYADETWSTYIPPTALESSPATGKGEGDYTIGVTGTYAPGATSGDVISADIAWEAMSFTYTEGSVGTWNPEIHDYTGGRPGVWSSNRPAITVTNHSNVGIDATFAFAAASGVTATGTFFTKDPSNVCTAITAAADQKIALATALGTTVAEAPKGSLYFGITGGSISESQTLGTITVTIAKEQWTEVSTNSALQIAITDGGRVKLTADFNMGTNNVQPLVPLDKSTMLDLNGHTLSGSSMYAIVRIGSFDCTIKNGTITNTALGSAKTVYCQASYATSVWMHAQ